MKNRFVLVILFLLSGVVTAFATPQIPDILIYEGKEYPIQSELLYDYFKKFPERDPNPADERCSALWRGYRATFEVANARIYLKDVFVNVCLGTPTTVLKKVVPNGETLYIDWISDLIDSGYGENHEDPYSIESMDAYEKYSLFEIEKGKILEVRNFDNKGHRLFKKKQFKAYQKTKDYDLELKAMVERNPRMNRSDADWNIEFFIFSYTKNFLVK